MNAPLGEGLNPNLLQPLRGLTAWVTGSSRGIGRAAAEELCRLGARVAVHGATFDSPTRFGAGVSMQQVADDIAAAHGAETLAVWGDLTVEREVKRIADAIRDRWGQIDLLVCCAGGDIGAKGYDAGRGGKPEHNDCLHIALDDFVKVMDRNLMSAVYCCREVAPEMMERKAGRIITIGSVGGLEGRLGTVTYCVAKAALHQYTRCLAVQLRPHDIPVNCVAPGATRSERWLEVYAGDKSQLVEGGTLVRAAHPREVASVIGFLCTPAAQFISGQVIRVDGGVQTFPC